MLNNLMAGLRRFWRGLFGTRPLTLYEEIVSFFGPEFERLQTHDKLYPGYDLASLNRALTAFFEECCDNFKNVGRCTTPSMCALFDDFKFNTYSRKYTVTTPTYERVPVDVGEEESFVNNGLYLAEMRPDAGLSPEEAARELPPDESPDPTEKIGVLLAVTGPVYEYWDGMDTRNVPRRQVTISIACRLKTVADRFFRAMEERRKRLSVYRGKVIDPVVHGGGIHTIGFRAIQKVREHDLILADDIKNLLDRSILGFYEHREVLAAYGIEMKRGILFHSPPGTGKTSISLYLASRLPHFTVCFVSGERLLYPREICHMARYLQPAMVVFEDIDLVAQERSINGLATVLGELMNQIDGCEPTEQVLFIMNTNSLERLEHAVKNRPGRVDQIIDIPLPEREERQRLLTHFARNVTFALEDREKVLDVTAGATPAMLKEIVKRAAVNAVQRLGPRDNHRPALTIVDADILLAVEQVRAMRDPEAVPGALGFRESKV
jgi:hypothetical protein